MAGASIEESKRAAVRLVTIDESSEGQRLDNFLLRELKGVPKTHVYRVIRAGEVRVNKGRAQADTRLEMGDVVRIPPVRVAEKPAETAAAAPAREFPILFEDEHLLVVNKPAGVAVHGGSGVSHGVIEQLRQARPQARFLELVHRLDKETSGVLVLAKKRSALTHLQDQFRGRETGKTYAALVWGDWPERLKVIDQALLKGVDAAGERHVRVVDAGHEGAKRSITLVKIAKRLGVPPGSPVGSPPPKGAGPARGGPAPGRAWATLLDVTIKTGRTHQIRVHLAQNGHAIVGDPKYGDFAKNKALAKSEARFERMFLHAKRLQFVHPASGEPVICEAPLPADCETLCATN